MLRRQSLFLFHRLEKPGSSADRNENVRKQLIPKNGNGRFNANDLSFDKYFATPCRLSVHCGGVFARTRLLTKNIVVFSILGSAKTGDLFGRRKGNRPILLFPLLFKRRRRSRENSKYARLSALVWTGSKGVFSEPSIVRVLGGNATAAKKQGDRKNHFFHSLRHFFNRTDNSFFSRSSRQDSKTRLSVFSSCAQSCNKKRPLFSCV